MDKVDKLLLPSQIYDFWIVVKIPQQSGSLVPLLNSPLVPIKSFTVS